MFFQNTFKNLLLPITSPRQVKASLPGAKYLAETLKAHLTVMRVVNPFDGGPKPVTEELRRLDPEGTGLDQHPLHVDANSDAASSITTYARERGMDAILASPASSKSPSSFLDNWRFTKRLVRASPCPVWFLRRRKEDVEANGVAEEAGPRVLCAVNGRDKDVVKVAGALSQSLNARLFLLHVIPEIHEGTLAYGFDDHISLSTAHAMQMLVRLQEESGTKAEVIIQAGSLSANIRKAAERLRAQVVVTSRTVKPGWVAPRPFPWSMPARYQTVVV